VHAQQHYEEQQHTYALDMNTQHVWDFAGNGFVHRLLTNQGDGKVVEHSLPPLSSEHAADGLARAEGIVQQLDFSMAATSSTTQDLTDFAREQALPASKGSKKSESVVSDFNMLLASQMTAQRRYFEEEMHGLEGKNKLELKELAGCRRDVAAGTEATRLQLAKVMEDNVSLEHELAQIAAGDLVLKRQIHAMEGLNKKFSNEQRKVEDRVADKEEQRKAARRQRDKDVAELQQQISDLELYVQMQKRCEGSADAADLQGSHVIITESDSRGHGRGGRRSKKH